MGDMNAKVGKRSRTDIFLFRSMVKGKSQHQWWSFLEFCDRSDLIISNNLFQHPSRHITTWQGQLRKPDEHQPIPIYNQIDYITVSQRYKTSVKDARSWAGCTLPSDHRLVTVDLLAPKQHGYRWHTTIKLTSDTDNLIQYRDLQKEFADAVAQKILTHRSQEGKLKRSWLCFSIEKIGVYAVPAVAQMWRHGSDIP